MPTDNGQSEINYLCYLIEAPLEATGEPMPFDGAENAFVALGYDFCHDPESADDFGLIDEIAAKIVAASVLFLCDAVPSSPVNDEG